MQINGANVGEIPPITILEEMPHWLTFVSVLYNTFPRPKPLSLENPGYFFPAGSNSGSSEDREAPNDMFFFFNTLLYDSLIRFDHDLSSTEANGQEYYFQFPLGRYIEQHFDIPVRWLTWGIYMDLEILFHNSDTMLSYCYSRIPDFVTAKYTTTPAHPTLSLGKNAWLSYICINDQNAEIFNELNDLVIALSPLVYRRPYYEQRLIRTNAVNRSTGGAQFNIQASRRPRFIILRALEYPHVLETTNVGKNFRFPWQFHWRQFDKCTCDMTMTYLSQSYHWRDIRWERKFGDGPHGTWEMWNQFKEIVGGQHHNKGDLKPIDYKEWYYTWPLLD